MTVTYADDGEIQICSKQHPPPLFVDLLSGVGGWVGGKNPVTPMQDGGPIGASTPLLSLCCYVCC